MLAGAVQESATWPAVAVAVRPVGAGAAMKGVATTLALGVPAPAAFTALTRKVYDVPFARPVMLYVVEVDDVTFALQ